VVLVFSGGGKELTDCDTMVLGFVCSALVAKR
jgi:hypothetical protein